MTNVYQFPGLPSLFSCNDVWKLITEAVGLDQAPEEWRSKIGLYEDQGSGKWVAKRLSEVIERQIEEAGVLGYVIGSHVLEDIEAPQVLATWLDRRHAIGMRIRDHLTAYWIRTDGMAGSQHSPRPLLPHERQSVVWPDKWDGSAYYTLGITGLSGIGYRGILFFPKDQVEALAKELRIETAVEKGCRVKRSSGNKTGTIESEPRIRFRAGWKITAVNNIENQRREGRLSVTLRESGGVVVKRHGTHKRAGDVSTSNVRELWKALRDGSPSRYSAVGDNDDRKSNPKRGFQVLVEDHKGPIAWATFEHFAGVYLRHVEKTRTFDKR